MSDRIIDIAHRAVAGAVVGSRNIRIRAAQGHRHRFLPVARARISPDGGRRRVSQNLELERRAFKPARVRSGEDSPLFPDAKSVRLDLLDRISVKRRQVGAPHHQLQCRSARRRLPERSTAAVVVRPNGRNPEQALFHGVGRRFNRRWIGSNARRCRAIHQNQGWTDREQIRWAGACS